MISFEDKEIIYISLNNEEYTDGFVGERRVYGGFKKALKFTPSTNNVISYSKYGDINPKLYYSYDFKSWKKWDGRGLPIRIDKPIYISGRNKNGLNKSASIYIQFEFAEDDDVFVEGDIMSLINGSKDTLIDEIPSDSCFRRLFMQTPIKNTPDMPATILKEYCYKDTYRGCTHLEYVSELPAMSVPKYAYDYMFYGCSNLSEVPYDYLPATDLEEYAYHAMFYGTAIAVHPYLPCDDVPSYAYWNMFARCENLKELILPASNVDEDSYETMINYSYNVSHVVFLAKSWSGSTGLSLYLDDIDKRIIVEVSEGYMLDVSILAISPLNFDSRSVFVEQVADNVITYRSNGVKISFSGIEWEHDIVSHELVSEYGTSREYRIEFDGPLTKIPDHAFARTSNVYAIYLPNTITEIGMGAFYNSPDLTTIAIPENVELIKLSAFYSGYNRTSAKFIMFPNNPPELQLNNLRKYDEFYQFDETQNIEMITKEDSDYSSWFENNEYLPGNLGFIEKKVHF